MSSDVESIFQPVVLDNFHEDMPPVQCIIWKGGNEYDTITLDMYPFDIVHTIKHLICNIYNGDDTFLPRFTFVGVPVGDAAYSMEEPNLDTAYIPADFLWYPQNTNDPLATFQLMNPIRAMKEPDLRFVSSDGTFSSPNYEVRGRSTMEDVFLKPRNGRLPVFHIFTLKYLLQAYRYQIPVIEEEWNKKFAPYFPDMNILSEKGASPYEATTEDIDFIKKIRFFVTQRYQSLLKINNLLQQEKNFSVIKLTGVRQLALMWKKPVSGYEGPASTFYNIPVTADRPFMRLIPAEGSAITKIHVKGVVPIPTLEDPRILDSWGKEITPTQGHDFCCIKYIQRPSIGILQALYGTIHLLYDGTIKLLLQPPKTVPRMDPRTDFNHFQKRLERIFEGMPQEYSDVSLKEISAIFSLKTSLERRQFNAARIRQRLPFFQSILKEIPSLPGDDAIITLRYKAVSQYATESRIFMFITQITTNMALDGENPDMNIITAIQNEFEISRREAADIFADWYQQRGNYTIQIPEEGEFIESFNPGIDIRIYSKHPIYHIHVTRIDNISSYSRIYTLLSMLFLEDDRHFMDGKPSIDEDYEEVEEEVEEENIKKEIQTDEKQEMEQVTMNINPADFGSIMNDPFADNTAAFNVMNDPFAEPTNTTTAANASTKHSMKPGDNSAVAAIAASSTVPLDDKDVMSKGEAIIGNVQPSQPKSIKRPTKKASSNQPIIKSAPIQQTHSRILHEVEQRRVNPKEWFLNKLKEIDKQLFGFSAATKGANAYSRKCAASDGRQPAILTQEQYENMRTIYENDRIFWVVYPLDGKRDPIPPIGTEETFYVMRFGSDANNINYYLCSEFYCLSCEIIVRQRDFEATEDRNGKPKPANTCPFCKGQLIRHSDGVLPGYTVIRRKRAPSSDGPHGAIRLMGKTTHPQNLSLPCCFVLNKPTRLDAPEFDHIRDALLPPAEPVAEDTKPMEHMEVIESDEEPDYKDLVVDAESSVQYYTLFENIHKQYIMDSNAQLSPGKFAAIPPMFDTFFHQNSKEDVVTRVSIKMKLRANAKGFVRIGTESTVYESLLGVLAPLLVKNTIAEVKDVFEQVVRPRVFMNSHFGNLVLEFFNPADGSAMPLTRQELMLFSQNELGIPLTSSNTHAAMRIFNAYKRFIRFIKDPSQRKDLRHIQPLLSEPELLTTRGLQLVIMEDNGKDPITIKCPTYGLSLDRHKKNDIAFISRTMKTIGATNNKYAHYELYVYTMTRPSAGAESKRTECIIRWDYASRRHWPEIITTRINEYLHQCQSRYRGIYSSQQGVHPMAMMSLSYFLQMSPIKPEGVIKDSYNHIVGLTLRSRPGSQSMVCVPVIDDGAYSILASVVLNSTYLDWNDVRPASVNEYAKMYDKLSNLFNLYPGYKLNYVASKKIDNIIIGIQLKNGIFLPAAPPNVPSQSEEQTLAELKLDVVSIDDFEWRINRELSATKDVSPQASWANITKPESQEDKCGSDPEIVHDTTKDDLEELYQVFRLMVSNWITAVKKGSGSGEIRRQIEEIIFNEDLPEYERRKRLYIVLSSTMLSWFYEDENKQWEMASTSFLRRDCRMIGSEDKCSGSCKWKESENKCLIHVPAEMELSEKKGERVVSTAEVFVKRVIDDLVRFPQRRQQLMRKGQISKVVAITKPIRDGDQYIIPETSITWSNLLRFDWLKQIPEQAKHYEEMSREATDADILLPNEDYPEDLRELIGDQSPYRVKMLQNDKYPLIGILSMMDVSAEDIGLENTSTEFTPESLIEYIHLKGRAIGLIRVNGKSSEVHFFKPKVGLYDSVLIIVQRGSAFGILIEEIGNIYIQVSKFPPRIAEAWKNVAVIQPRPIVIDSEDKLAPPLLLGSPQVLEKQRRVPLVVQARVEESGAPEIVKLVTKPLPAPVQLESALPKSIKRVPKIAASSATTVPSVIQPNAQPVVPKSIKRVPKIAVSSTTTIPSVIQSDVQPVIQPNAPPALPKSIKRVPKIAASSASTVSSIIQPDLSKSIATVSNVPEKESGSSTQVNIQPSIPRSFKRTPRVSISTNTKSSAV